MSNGKKKDLARIISARLAGATQQVDAVRSTKGQIKGALTQDTLYRLRQALADHKSGDEEGAGDRLAVILGMCSSYMERHGGETDARARDKVAAVAEIQEQASLEWRDWGQRQAQAVYARDVYAGTNPGAAPAGGIKTKTQFQRETPGAQSKAKFQSRQLAAGKAGNPDEGGFNQATLDLIKKYGLTEAEVLAVKVYTVDDYRYINPANANDMSRLVTYINPPDDDDDQLEDQDLPQDPLLADLLSLPEMDPKDVIESMRQADEELEKLLEELDPKGKLPERRYRMATKLDENEGRQPDAKGTEPEGPKAKDPMEGLSDKELSHIKQLFEEGSLHGAMAIAALKKLPAREGLCYRGMRMTEKAFRERYEQPTIEPETLRQLTSIATTRAAAQAFADGQGCRDLDKKVSVLTCVDVQTGRDIGDLSVHGRKEKEWLLLPGTVIQADSVEDFETGTIGSPKANRWVVVQSHEVV